MSVIVRAALSIPWMAALYGTLQIHQLNLHMGHSICGPWGCGPPAEALIGYHAFWLVLFVPLGIAMGWIVPQHLRRRIGITVALLGLAGTVCYMSWDAFAFYQSSQAGDLLLQRALFALATAVDFPVVPLGIAGLAMLWGTSKPKTAESTFVDSTSAPQSP